MPLTPGARFGTYEVLAPLGAGGMGEVYRARDTRLKREVALKVLPDAFSQDPDRLARFQREAELLATLNHPNIAAVYGLEQAGGVTAIILELVEGETLEEMLARSEDRALPKSGGGRYSGRPLTVNEALPIARQIADALETAHEKGVIHRDLKPANIKVTPHGTVKVLDFGLAKLADPVGAGLQTGPSSLSQSPTITTPAMTHAGMILGTAAYMSPEQARGKPVDKRADIWAFGCVLYEMLTGTRAFLGETTADTIAAILEREPDWNGLPAATPASIRRLLERCLTKDPRRRFRDIGDASLDLAEPGSSERTAPVAKPDRRAWMTIGVLVLALVAALIPTVLYFGSTAPPARDVRLEIPVPSGSMNLAPAISPDGRRLVYVAASGNDKTALWLRPLNAVEAEVLPGTDGGVQPFWSPDSRWVAFFAGGKLKKVDAAGGLPQVLTDVAGIAGGTWNRDGIIVYASTVLRRIADSGGDATDVTELDTSLKETFHSFPSFLPDGRHFLYVAGSGTPESRRVYIGSLASKTRTQVMGLDSRAIYASGFLLFGHGGSLVARPFDLGRLEFTGDALPLAEDFNVPQGRGPFDASEEGTLIYRLGGGVATANRPLLWMDRTGKPSGPVGARAPTNLLRLSPDGKRVAFYEGSATEQDGVGDVWIYDIDRDQRTKLTTGPSINHMPVWSPDGSRLVFDSSRGKYVNGHALFEKPSNGATPERLLLEPEPGLGLGARDWSRDGLIVFSANKRGTPNNSDLWVLPLSGDRKPFPYLTTPFNESEASLSPNGRWLAYTSNESGSYEVIVRSFPDSSKDRRQISSQGGFHPRWSRDGREVYYLDPGRRIVAVAVTADQNLEIGKSTPLFDTSIPFPTLPAGPAYPYDVAPDGRFLLSAPPDTTSKPIIVVLNWAAGLKRH